MVCKTSLRYLLLEPLGWLRNFCFDLYFTNVRIATPDHCITQAQAATGILLDNTYFPF